MGKILAIAAGSLAGGFGRYYLSGFVSRIGGPSFPYGTLLVNLTGCFLIGFFYAWSEEMNPETRLLLMAGFCGAFTTFSTFILETSALLKNGQTLAAFLNLFLSIVLGFLLFRIGAALGEFI